MSNPRKPNSRSVPSVGIATLILLGGFPAHAQSITAVRSSIKVRPSDNPPAATSIELHAAKNEFEAFQVVILGGPAGLSNVTVVSPTLTLDGSTTTIPASEVRLYREQPICFTLASNPEGGAGCWPDPLVPAREDGPAIFAGTWTEGISTGETRGAFPTAVPAGGNVVVFVDIHVPTSQTPGTYRGTLTVQSGASTVGTPISVVLLVRNFALPSTSALPTAFGATIDNMCRAHGAPLLNGFCANGNADYHLWARLYGRFLLDHRITMMLPDSPNIANWPGTFASYNTDYGPLVNGTDTSQRLTGARMTTLLFPWFQRPASKTAPPIETQSSATPKMSNWASFMKDATSTYNHTFPWFNITFHYAWPDEPGSNCNFWNTVGTPGYINDQGTWAHSVDTNFRVMVTGTVADYNACNGGSAVNILNPVVDNVDGKPATPAAGNHRIDYNSFVSALPGVNTMWMYQSCDSHGCGTTTNANAVNWPSVMVDATGVQNRSEPWMHFIYNAPGMLYYEIANRLPTAWQTDGIWDPVILGQGDGTLVYPGTPTAIQGTTHIPVASYRLKMLREGLEDYEYLRKCEAVNSGLAMNIARGVFPMVATGTNGQPTGSMYGASSYPNATPTPTDFANRVESARDQLVDCIVPTLTVAKTGTGTGRVTSSPAGIDCGASCSARFTNPTNITLTATADPNSTFVGFSGGCATSMANCTFTISAPTTVTAQFSQNPPACGPTNCPNGCCDGAVCRGGTTNAYCGAPVPAAPGGTNPPGGQACFQCSSPDQCGVDPSATYYACIPPGCGVGQICP